MIITIKPILTRRFGSTFTNKYMWIYYLYLFRSLQTDEETNNGPTANVTKPQLTGIPQIDYVLDPNLPRELNGHNLTDYPFYNALPEDIDFKCDGLHDGFYASVPHKCQVSRSLVYE